MKNMRIIAVGCVAFTCGIISEANIPEKSYANVVRPQVKLIRKAAKKTVVGSASWYSEQSPGINYRTANNEIFDDADYTCAMWDVPFDQRIKVTNLENGKSVIVRVNDRGPHRRYVRKGRVIDLTKKAFRRISPLKKGLIKVHLEFL